MIKATGLHKTYVLGGSEVKALDGVSVQIRAGEFVAVMGASGSGKSTLLQVLGLLDVPDKGSYRLKGREISHLGPDGLAALRSETLGFIFQQFNLLARTSAMENVALPRLYHPLPASPDKAAQLLKLVGLQDRMDHTPAQLSGGQQQRVAIARALMNDPAVLFADEPTGNLDSKSSREILDILSKLNAQGITVIMVTHEADIAARAGRVITMRDGRIISDKGGAARALKSKIQRSTAAPVPSKNFIAAMSTYSLQAWRALMANKVRSALSVLGILIGVAAVIAMMAIGRGAQKAIQAQLSGLGSNLLMINPGAAHAGGVRSAAGTSIKLSLDDAAAVAGQVPFASKVSPEVGGRAQAVAAGKNWNTQVSGTGVDYATMRASVPALGRFFTAEEVQTRARVAVLGVTVSRQLFGEASPLGQMVKLNRVYFRVIGVLPAKGSSGWRDEDDKAIVPVTTAMYRLFGKESLDTISVEVRSAAEMEEAQEALKALMRKRLRLAPEKEDPFQIFNLADIQKAVQSTSTTLTALLSSIAAISLLVGGIGIMNIMLVSVTERTREIGLRKALGARRADILMQFLIEAVVISLAGGIMGMSLGALVSFLVSSFAGWATEVSASSVILSVFFSGSVGIVFGLWPARQASQLDPIQALRYE